MILAWPYRSQKVSHRAIHIGIGITLRDSSVIKSREDGFKPNKGTILLNWIRTSNMVEYMHRTFIWGRHAMGTLSGLLASVRGIHRSPVASLHKGPVIRTFDVSLNCWAKTEWPVIWPTMTLMWRYCYVSSTSKEYTHKISALCVLLWTYTGRFYTHP